MTYEGLAFETKCIHAGQRPEPMTGAIMTPVFQTSTFAQESPGRHKGYEYSRTHNPTRKVLEECLAKLENGKHGFCFSSGCAAATALMLSLRPGDHVIAMEDLYGGTRRLFEKVFAPFGIDFTFADLSETDNLTMALNNRTKMIWLESPSNPLLRLTDIRGVAQAKGDRAILVVDNTFATPALQNPLLLGADVVVHSTTKYIGGHSDVIGGAIITNSDSLAEQISFLSNSIGGIPAPWDCFLVLRGLKTLHVRMQRHCENAQMIATRLSEHRSVSHVFYPGLPHPQSDLAEAQMRGFSGMISFVVKGGEEHAKKICEQTRLFTCAESLGGIESLIEHPASMTHASIEKAMRQQIGIDDGLLRVSVGIENAMDLWLDLKNAIDSF